ncbi:MAG: acetyl-CoA carboxylase biotin carboxylase subunit [Planctomycetota bacterium]
MADKKGASSRPFARVLVANRGEIALRIGRTAREMGMEWVAVYSEPDRSALHTRFADVAYALGGRTPRESYLDVAKIVRAAKETGAEAIHPGYGFLAENANFARAVEEAGLVWIGPPPSAIVDMGDKITSRKLMAEAGVPIVPGLAEPLADAAAAKKAAEAVGYPIALKASAGGGGKGIRVVRDPADLEGAFRTASGEALAAFGDGRMYLERYLDQPRHVEVQVLFDAHGNGVHYGERECSIQRRHQKLVEECPSPVVDAKTRAAMGEAALKAARAVGYVGAGTVEFLWSKGEFFFLEMNTRLQVEHPITEMVTGRDLVREQIRVAAGEPLGYGQDAVVMNGHAIEVRINAEDPMNRFLPSTGVVQNLRMPGGPWVRLDSCLYNGLEVGLEYDPMLAKLIVWGSDRPQAIARMKRALQELNVGGVSTGAPAALRVLGEEAFVRGEYDTHFLESLDLTQDFLGMSDVAAIAAAIHRYKQSHRTALQPTAGRRDGWLERGRRSLTTFPLPQSSNDEGGANR